MPDTNVTLKQQTEREVWPDILRILAAFAVIMLHAASPGFFKSFPVNSIEWHFCNFYHSITRFCVSVFVMVSGVFLLDSTREYSIKKIATVKIWRLVCSYLIWSSFYAAIKMMHAEMGFKDIFYEVLVGHYHLWFMFMICGLYLMTPFLREINKNETLLKYFFVLSFSLVFLVETINLRASFSWIKDWITSRLQVTLFSGFTIYFLLGHYLAHHNFSRNTRYIMYILGLISALGTVIVSGLVGATSGIPKTWMLKDHCPNVLFLSSGIFLFIRQAPDYLMNLFQKHRKLLNTIGRLTFGIYLIHAFILEHLYLIGLPDYFIHPAFSIPITSLVTFLISLAIVWLLDKIPVVKKYAL